MKRSNRRFIAGLTVAIATILQGCAPRVATSFWRIGSPADSARADYAVLHEGSKVRHCYPVTEWTDSFPSLQGGVGGRPDTYHSFHHHGVAVESEQMAYRIYFDKKQTIDIYCKRTPRLELATSYWYPDDSLLALGYGDDILRVSGTVGVGSVKYWNGKKHVHIAPVAERSQRIVRQSRNEATIEVADKGWHYGCIYIAPNQGTGISNTAVEGKAVKTMINGELFILRNGKTYNVQGQQLK